MDLSLAQKVLATAIAHAETLGARLSISVVDAAGNEIVTARMDGAFDFTPHVARTKARTAVALKMDSADVAALSAHAGLFDLIAQHTGFMPTTLGGGVVVKDGDTVLGAVAGSGGSPEQDAEAARAGVAVWLSA